MESNITLNIKGVERSFNVKWKDSTDFSNIKNLTRVYGVIFNDKDKILIVDPVGNWQLPGGKPELGESIEQTLRREILEEANAEIKELIPLGYQEIMEKGHLEIPVSYQIAFIARISKLGRPKIDPATGIIPKRKFIKPSDFLNYCSWGEMGAYIIDRALEIINHKIESNRSTLPFRKNTEGYFLDHKGNLLAQHKNNYLSFPGGGVDEKETPSQAIIREAFEETGAKINNLKQIGKLKFIWGKDWAKTEKQRKRYKIFQGEEMHFFTGDILNFENPSILEEDFWKGDKLIPINEAIKIIESGKPFSKDIKEYREMQLKFLNSRIKA